MNAMIRSAKDPRVWTLLEGQTPRRFPTGLARSAMRRLRALREAVVLEELR